MRKTLTDKGVAALKPRVARYAHPDPELRGHYIRVQPSGTKAFWAVARTPAGKQIWTHVGAADVLKIDEARKTAGEVIKRVRAGLSAFEPPPTVPDSFKAVAELWMKRYVQAKELRSETDVQQRLENHIYPRWQDRPFTAIRRGDVTSLLDDIEDKFGPRAADHVLEIVRRIMNWYATRNDDYVVPLVKGMRRWNPTENARERILDDNELKAVWKVAAEANGTFGALVRLALLTASRRDKLASMKWADVSETGVWSIPLVSDREKGTAGELKLPKAALDIVHAQPKIGDNAYVFAGRGDAHISGYSKLKSLFDKKLQEAGATVAPWTIHDLRRTARSLMSRAGVRPDIAERVLGHKQQGVKGVYDRHEYFDEKAQALKKLAALIDGIVHPKDNIVPMTGKRRKKK